MPDQPHHLYSALVRNPKGSERWARRVLVVGVMGVDEARRELWRAGIKVEDVLSIGPVVGVEVVIGQDVALARAATI